jgi:hypothetical protein
MPRVLICGSRDWHDERVIGSAVAALPLGSTVIHGAAPGADTIAARAASRVGTLNVEAYPANWAQYGRAAGPIRNKLMLELGRPDLVIAFRLDGPSKGTDNMIQQARKAGVPVTVVSGKRRESR